MQFTAVTASALLLLPLAFSKPVTMPRNPIGQLLFGPITIPSGVGINNISITLINFNDEVVDFSSVSIFGDINDGGCEENEQSPQEAANNPSPHVVGPIAADRTEIRDAQITLINFNDEVVDISSITIFGDVNDGACPPPPSRT